jgi:hypothetical protein
MRNAAQVAQQERLVGAEQHDERCLVTAAGAGDHIVEFGHDLPIIANTRPRRCRSMHNLTVTGR